MPPKPDFDAQFVTGREAVFPQIKGTIDVFRMDDLALEPLLCLLEAEPGVVAVTIAAELQSPTRRLLRAAQVRPRERPVPRIAVSVWCISHTKRRLRCECASRMATAPRNYGQRLIILSWCGTEARDVA
jgi:hypothetical protein